MTIILHYVINMTPEEILDLIEIYTPLDGQEEYLRYLHSEYKRITGRDVTE